MNNENKLTQHNIDIQDTLTCPLRCRLSTVDCLDRAHALSNETEAVVMSRPLSQVQITINK